MSTFEKKRLLWARVTALSAVGALLILGALALYIARTVSEFRAYEKQVDVIVDRLDDVSAQLSALNLTEIVTTVNGISTELKDVDISGIVTALNGVSAQLEGLNWKELAGNVSSMAVNAQESLTNAQKAMEKAMTAIDKLDIDALNKAIADLQTVVEPLAAFAAKFQ